MLKQVFILIGFILTIIVTFQNCARGGDERSMAYVVKNDNPNPAWVADTGLIDNIEGLSCFQNYISVFEWKNPNANLMSEKPQLGSKKLVSLKLKNDSFSDPHMASGWRIEGLVKISPDGQSSSAVQFIKGHTNSSDSLDCYFMRAADDATLEVGLANVLFKNIGADMDANIFVGFLRHSEQFIACRVTAGQGDIELKSDEEESTWLGPSQAFVLKRGCHQDQ